LFEVSNTSGVAMAPKLHELLDRFSLTHKIITVVKYEMSNLRTCVSALTSIISCNNLGFLEPFDGTSFKHALSKIYLYATANEKVSTGLPLTSIKATQSSLQKNITWPKNQARESKHGTKLAFNQGYGPKT
jgi:hypothetical protein